MCQPQYIDYCDELIAMLADMINSFMVVWSGLSKIHENIIIKSLNKKTYMGGGAMDRFCTFFCATMAIALALAGFTLLEFHRQGSQIRQRLVADHGYDGVSRFFAQL